MVSVVLMTRKALTALSIHRALTSVTSAWTRVMAATSAIRNRQHMMVVGVVAVAAVAVAVARAIADELILDVRRILKVRCVSISGMRLVAVLSVHLLPLTATPLIVTST